MRGLLPENVATFTGIDDLIVAINYIVGAWFIFAFGILIAFALMFKRKPGVPAQYIAGNTPKQLGFLIGLVALITMFDFGLDVMNIKTWQNAKMYLPETQNVVRVNAQQFMWSFTYPGADGQFDTEDDVEADEMHILLDQDTIFEVRSKDVLHSFGVANMRLKLDVVPGRVYKNWVHPIKAGTYNIHCAEICGVGHGGMAASVVVESPEDFKNWMKEQTAGVKALKSNQAVASLTIQ